MRGMVSVTMRTLVTNPLTSLVPSTMLFLLLSAPAQTYTVSHFLTTVNLDKPSSVLGETFTRPSERDLPFHRIEQGVAYALDKANINTAEGLNNKLNLDIANKLSRSVNNAGAFALMDLENDLISPRADIMKERVNTIVATTLKKANPAKIIPNITTTMDDAIRKGTPTLTLNEIVSERLFRNIGTIVSNDQLNGITKRAETFRSRQPRDLFVSGFGVLGPRRCVKQPASQMLNLTSVTYDYPENVINLELHERPEVMLEIFRSRRPNLKQTDEAQCFSTKETLEAFYVQGVKCWLIFPRHQNVQFYRCRQARCGRGARGARGVVHECTSSDDITPLWAWCNTTFGGHKIIKFELPLPVNCSCIPVPSC